MNIAVYCSSSNYIDSCYLSIGRPLGRWIAEAGHTLIYGGTFMGLMGEVAKAVEEVGGERIGVNCKTIYEMRDVVIDTHNLLILDTLDERKSKLVELADAHIILPGGFGTLDEASNILALKQIGDNDTPVIFYNVNNFYSPLIAQFSRYYEEKFQKRDFQKAYKFVTSLEELKACL